MYSFLNFANFLALYKGFIHLPSTNRPLEFLKISATSGWTEDFKVNKTMNIRTNLPRYMKSGAIKSLFSNQNLIIVPGVCSSITGVPIPLDWSRWAGGSSFDSSVSVASLDSVALLHNFLINKNKH